LLFHRKSKAFAFDVLGPRVPAVVVSPLIPPGTLDQRVHDHASVPATVRAVFAPDAAPLTARDAWSPPFSELASLAEPRTDLPDLSAWVRTAGLTSVVPATGPVAGESPVAAETEVADAVPEATAQPAPPVEIAAAAPEAVPAYYRDFIKQAEQVREHLAEVGEPEVMSIGKLDDVQDATEVTQAFIDAAHRHRHQSLPSPVPPPPGSQPANHLPNPTEPAHRLRPERATCRTARADHQAGDGGGEKGV